jgi:hypothetical protein
VKTDLIESFNHYGGMSEEGQLFVRKMRGKNFEIDTERSGYVIKQEVTPMFLWIAREN